MGNSVLNSLSLGTKPLYERHLKFHTLISEFNTKLATPKNRAKPTSLEIDQFYQNLKSFERSYTLFPKYYRKYIDHLKRLKPDADDDNPDWTLLQIALAENKWKPTLPFPILIHHIKYNYKITSILFLAYQKRQNRKKLNAPIKPVEKEPKTNVSKEWIKVPLPRNRAKR